MPKRADGPTSGRYRFGGREAFRAGLSQKAVDPRSRPNEGDLARRQTLAKFAAYLERTHSIGKPLPATRGISKRRAAVFHEIEEVQRREAA
jgi:hypothetical protein